MKPEAHLARFVKLELQRWGDEAGASSPGKTGTRINACTKSPTNPRAPRWTSSTAALFSEATASSSGLRRWSVGALTSANPGDRMRRLRTEANLTHRSNNRKPNSVPGPSGPCVPGSWTTLIRYRSNPGGTSSTQRTSSRAESRLRFVEHCAARVWQNPIATKPEALACFGFSASLHTI